MMAASQKYSLKWNEFGVNVASTMRALHTDLDFVDVTIACADGARLGAHKLVLSSVSVFFRDVLKQFPCEHPILVLNETSEAEAMALLEFAYTGEVNVSQDVLPALLHTAREYAIKGLDQVENPVPDASEPQVQRLLSDHQRGPQQGGEHQVGEGRREESTGMNTTTTSSSSSAFVHHFLAENNANLNTNSDSTEQQGQEESSNYNKRRRHSGSTGNDEALNFLCRTPPPKRWKRSFTMNSTGSDMHSFIDEPTYAKKPSVVEEKPLYKESELSTYTENRRRSMPFSLPTSPVPTSMVSDPKVESECLAIDYSRPMSRPELKKEQEELDSVHSSRPNDESRGEKGNSRPDSVPLSLETTSKALATSTSPIFKSKSAATSASMSSDVEGRYYCDICGKVFKHPGSLQHHRHIHRGTHCCPTCGKAFSRRWDLERHMNKSKYGCPANRFGQSHVNSEHNNVCSGSNMNNDPEDNDSTAAAANVLALAARSRRSQ